MHHFVFFDESGDLGWTLNKPYQRGGSSRYLTIAYFIIPENIRHLPKRVILNCYKKFKINPNIELKGNDLSVSQKEYFAQKVVKLLENNADLKIGAITVKKEKVQEHIRIDRNKLYNYMINLACLNQICLYKAVRFYWDERSIKVKSGNSLIDYLTIRLWFELDSQTSLSGEPCKSHKNRNILFIDWIVNIIWLNYEFGRSDAFKILRPHLQLSELFFRKES